MGAQWSTFHGPLVAIICHSAAAVDAYALRHGPGPRPALAWQQRFAAVKKRFQSALRGKATDSIWQVRGLPLRWATQPASLC